MIAVAVALPAGILVALLVGGRDETRRVDATAPSVSIATTAAGAATTAATQRPAPPGTPARLRLPLARAAAQVFAVGFPGRDATTPFLERLRAHDWGVVLLGRENYVDRAQLRLLVRELQAVARNERRSPPLLAAIQAGGENSAFGDLPPRAQPLQGTAAGATRDARAAARALRSVGVRMTLAPEADLAFATGPAIGRAFGESPRRVAALALASARAYRGAGVATAVGHFPGQGAASQDPLAGPATVGLDLAALRAADLRPFRAVAGTTPAMLMSNASYVAFDGVTPASLSPDAIALLRSELRFRGVVVADDLGAAASIGGSSVGRAAVDALRAGADLLLVPGDAAAQDEAYRAVLTAVRRGRLPRARLAEALDRVLALKRAFALR